MPYKSFQNSHGHFEDYAIWYHMYFNTYHSKLGLRVTYLTFLRDETLFLRLQCRVSLCESLTDVSKNVTTFAFSGLYLGWTRTSSMEEKKIPVFSSYRWQDDIRLDKRLGLNSNLPIFIYTRLEA